MASQLKMYGDVKCDKDVFWQFHVFFEKLRMNEVCRMFIIVLDKMCLKIKLNLRRFPLDLDKFRLGFILRKSVFDYSAKGMSKNCVLFARTALTRRFGRRC